MSFKDVEKIYPQLKYVIASLNKDLVDAKIPAGALTPLQESIVAAHLSAAYRVGHFDGTGSKEKK